MLVLFKEAVSAKKYLKVVWNLHPVNQMLDAMGKRNDQEPVTPSRVPGRPSTKQLLRSALSDLRAAEYLRAQLPHTDRQVLKLIDDAAELVLKATLAAKGIDTEGRPFPWLIKTCQTERCLPNELEAMHRLRNQVKHGGAHAPEQEVADAYRAVVEFTKLLKDEFAVGMTYCVKCHTGVPMFVDELIEMKGHHDVVRRAGRSWCFICDAQTFKIFPKKES